MTVLPKTDLETDFEDHQNEFTHVDLFAGIGGFSLAFEAEGFRTVAYSEINPDKCLVYNHHFPAVRNLGDIKAITRNEVGRVDVLTGGVPCQPASALGQMRGTADERWLWPETIGLVRLFRPAYGVFENPPSLLVLESGRAWNGIVSGLVACGYDCWWDVFPAAAFGAGHLRERVLLVIADASRSGRAARAGLCQGEPPRQRSGRLGDTLGAETTTHADGIHDGRRGQYNAHKASARDQTSNSVAQRTFTHADGQGLQGHAGHGANGQGWPGSGRSVAPPDLRGRVAKADWWHEANTGVPVLAHGLPAKLVEAAARCAGDAVVPQVVRPIARAIYQQLIAA